MIEIPWSPLFSDSADADEVSGSEGACARNWFILSWARVPETESTAVLDCAAGGDVGR